MRNALVSVIIPTKNSGKTICDCLNSIYKQTYRQIEIIVVDNYSSDNTCALASDFTKNIYKTRGERSIQRNWGAKHAKGRYLLFVDSDMHLKKGVIQSCVKKIHKERYRGVVIPEKSKGSGFWAECKKLERESLKTYKSLEALRFIEKKTFFSLKGYNSKIVGTEDFDLSQRFVFKYGDKALGRIRDLIIHNEGSLDLFRLLQKKYYYGKTILRYRQNIVHKDYYQKQMNILFRLTLIITYGITHKISIFIVVGAITMKILEFCALFLGAFYSFMYQK